MVRSFQEITPVAPGGSPWSDAAVDHALALARVQPFSEGLAGAISPGYPAEAHNGAWSNTVTLPGPKGGSNREYKAELNTEGASLLNLMGYYYLLETYSMRMKMRD